MEDTSATHAVVHDSTENLTVCPAGLAESHAARRERRIPYRKALMLELFADDGASQNASAELLDVSARGIGLQLDARLPPGQRFSLNLQTRKGPCAMFYEVRSTARTPEGHWRIGAESIGVLGTNAERPERIIMALLTGQPESAA